MNFEQYDKASMVKRNALAKIAGQHGKNLKKVSEILADERQKDVHIYISTTFIHSRECRWTDENKHVFMKVIEWSPSIFNRIVNPSKQMRDLHTMLWVL